MGEIVKQHAQVGMLLSGLYVILQKLKLFKLVNFRPHQIFITYTLYSIVIYGYQLFLEAKNKIKSWLY